MEALRRALTDPVSAFPIVTAGPAHVATLKTVEPPLRALEGRRLAGAERRAKRLLLPTDDGELVLVVHLMTNGRLRHLRAGEEGPKLPAFQLAFAGGGRLALTEPGARKQAGVWLFTAERADEELSHIGPDALGLPDELLHEILAREPRRLHSLLRDQCALAGIGRAWANEILHRAQLSPFAVSTELDEEEARRLGSAIQTELTRGLALREAGANDKRAYRVHGKLGHPCYACGMPLARVEFEDFTVFYCPGCQTGGRVLNDRRLSRLLR
jgi:formamidopyrimidine-DNA glycosylase